MNPTLKQRANDFLSAHGCQSKIKIGYGCTENTGMATSQFHVGESTEQNEYQTVGIPALFTGVAIQAEDGGFMKTGERGEILLFGSGVMQGYLNNPEETAKVIETINGTRYLHTGDIGSVDADGCVYVLGRIKRIIVRPDGHNVFPAHIENAVQKHPAVEACVCVGAKSKEYTNGQIPVAFLQLAQGNTASQAVIIEEIKELSLRELPERDVALEYFVIDQIPMTPNAKADYLALEKLAEEKINEIKK